MRNMRNLCKLEDETGLQQQKRREPGEKLIKNSTYPFPCVNIRNIHQRIMIGQHNRFDFVHDFDAKLCRIDAILVEDEFLHVQHRKNGRTLQIFRMRQLKLFGVSGIDLSIFV